MTKAGAEKLDARIIAWTRPRKPADGATPWSRRKRATALPLNPLRGARVWSKAGRPPHRCRPYRTSDDPEFAHKAAPVLGRYLKPPVNAVVCCVDEKTASPALGRLDPVLPRAPGRAERHGGAYFRHGTLSL